MISLSPRLALWLLLIGLAAPAAHGTDRVHLRDGTVLTGDVVTPRFTMITPYATFRLDRSEVARMIFQEGNADRLETRSGDRFTGRLSPRRIAIAGDISGQQVAVIPLADIQLLTLDEPVVIRRQNWPDRIEMRNGDRFRARVTAGDFLIRSGDGMKMFQRSEIHALDLESGSPEAMNWPQVQLIANTHGKPLRGQLINGVISLVTPHGGDLDVKPRMLSSVELQVFPKGLSDEEIVRRMVSSQRHRPLLIRDRLASGGYGPEMVILRGGSFIRGDLQGDGDGDEHPVREITLPKPFAIGIHEVTFAEYDRYCADTGRPLPSDSGWGRGDRPVVNVNWREAVAYANWLSSQTGQRYRLPTDAEWEYAARGGTRSVFWWGDSVGDARAVCAGCGSLWDDEKTAPTGRFPANPFGLHDTAGNVWEWTADCYHDSFAAAPVDGGAIEKPGCGKRVIRGGAWSFPPSEMRSANRWRDFPNRRSDDTGFRLVRELDY
jgi:formylglycine-generating enzyme required for sulfatase activity